MTKRPRHRHMSFTRILAVRLQVKSFASIVAGGEVTPTAIGVLVGVTVVVFVSVVAVVVISRRVSAREKARLTAAYAARGADKDEVAPEPEPSPETGSLQLEGDTDRSSLATRNGAGKLFDAEASGGTACESEPGGERD